MLLSPHTLILALPAVTLLIVGASQAEAQLTLNRNVPLVGRTNAIPANSRLQNISTRGFVQTGDNVLIGGFIINGDEPRKIVLRAISSSLVIGGQPLAGRLADPTLELYRGSTLLKSNDDWKENQAEMEATSLAPTNDSESAIVATLEPGGYTAIVRGKNGSNGIALAEIYDVSLDRAAKVANLSARGFVQSGDNVMIGGFIVGPPDTLPADIVIRGLGPSLQGNLPVTLNDPVLEIYDHNGMLIESNDDWQQSSGASQIQASGLAPSSPTEAAVFLSNVAPGNYTAILRGKNDAAGIGLVEVYEVQPTGAQTFSFEDGLAEWVPKGTDLNDPPVQWSIAPSPDRASDGSTSVKFSLSNLNDAGKIWIERPFVVQPNTTYSVNTKFSFATADFGEVNGWSIIAGVSSQPALTRADLTYRDDTGNGESSDTGYQWLEKNYYFTATSGPDGQLYVQLGVWGTWETLRTYYFDYVRIALQPL